MVIARFSKWAFKEGKRDELFQQLDSTFGNIARKAKGFRGVLSMLDKEDPNVGIVITLWTDEDSLKKSQLSVLQPAIQDVLANLKEPVSAKTYRVFTAELTQLIPKSEYY